jgi:chromosome segregation ATPase
MQMDNKDHHSKLQRYEVEQERLKGVETFLKEQLKALENVVLQKNQELEHSTKEREKEKVQWEEKVVYVTMQLQQVKQQRDEMINVLKPKLEEEIQRYKQESELYASKWKSLQNQKDEEKEILLSSNKEMIIALQQRLLQIEPESAHFKERCHELERHLQALKVMKMEQDNVVTALTKDLQNARDQSQQLSTLPQELLDWKEKYEQMSLKYTQVQEKCTKLQEENEEKQGTITRLRSEATVTERNYAMKTAMLATCEAQLETFQQEIHEKDLKMKEMLDMTSTSQQQITSLEQKMQQLVQEYQEKEQKLLETKQQEDQAKEQELSKWKEDSQQMIENLKKDFAKKSAMARQLLSEREDEVRSLSQKVKELQDEIASGAPTDRKILELAKEQSKRDAMNVMHR